MGYSKDGSITNYWPDDNEDEIFLDNDVELSYMLERIKEKWPDATMEQITISSEYIHTNCLYYDLYDSGDWTHFIRISREK